jgi:hypothetical protein
MDGFTSLALVLLPIAAGLAIALFELPEWEKIRQEIQGIKKTKS